MPIQIDVEEDLQSVVWQFYRQPMNTIIDLIRRPPLQLILSLCVYLLFVHPPDVARGVLDDAGDVDGAADVDEHLRLAQDPRRRH